MTDLERWVRGLGEPADAADPVRLTGDEWASLGPDPTFTAYAGLVHLLSTSVAPSELEHHLASLETRLLSSEGLLHYKAFEVSGRAERLERAGRMQRAEVRATRDWLIPRLERDIALYERRVAALEALVGVDDA